MLKSCKKTAAAVDGSDGRLYNDAMKSKINIFNLLLAVLKGTLVGLAVVIPGVSGGSMLLAIGVYEDAVSITSKDKTRRRAAIKKLIPYAIGIVLGVAALSFVITWLLDSFEFFTILLFSGLILGSLPMLFRQIKGHKVKPGYIIVALVMIAVMVLLPYLNDNTSERFKLLYPTDTLSVGERIVMADETQEELIVQNGIRSAPSTRSRARAARSESRRTDTNSGAVSTRACTMSSGRRTFSIYRSKGTGLC